MTPDFKAVIFYHNYCLYVLCLDRLYHRFKTYFAFFLQLHFRVLECKTISHFCITGRHNTLEEFPECVEDGVTGERA